jgi:hypothetical protein
MGSGIAQIGDQAAHKVKWTKLCLGMMSELREVLVLYNAHQGRKKAVLPLVGGF